MRGHLLVVRRITSFAWRVSWEGFLNVSLLQLKENTVGTFKHRNSNRETLVSRLVKANYVNKGNLGFFILIIPGLNPIAGIPNV